MKKYCIIDGFAVGFVFLLSVSCDKIHQIYKPKNYDTELNTALYPGDWQQYIDHEWPSFDEVPLNTERNVLIEDFTGHNCQYCPAAAIAAHQQHIEHPSRVFVSSIHSSATGLSAFQFVTDDYPIDFSNTNGVELGKFFGNMASSGFEGNPAVGASRVQLENGGEIYYASGNLSSEVAKILTSTLKVSIRGHLNYYPSTKGAFLHTAIDVLDNTILAQNLATTVVIQQDSLIAPQNVLNTRQQDYVHRDIHRMHLNQATWGVALKDEFKKESTSYFLDYSFVVPNALDLTNTSAYHAENMHALVYVYDRSSYEIYQVVRIPIVSN